MKLKFVDLNNSLVEKVKLLGVDSEHGDYFRKSLNVPRAVLMTASNPQFSFGGGIDALFDERFPFDCQFKQIKGGGNERISNICFTITVDSNYKATRELVRQALDFSIKSLCEHETLVFSGIGTGIGGLSEDVFCEILKELL